MGRGVLLPAVSVPYRKKGLASMVRLRAFIFAWRLSLIVSPPPCHLSWIGFGGGTQGLRYQHPGVAELLGTHLTSTLALPSCFALGQELERVSALGTHLISTLRPPWMYIPFSGTAFSLLPCRSYTAPDSFCILRSALPLGSSKNSASWIELAAPVPSLPGEVQRID